MVHRRSVNLLLSALAMACCHPRPAGAITYSTIDAPLAAHAYQQGTRVTGIDGNKTVGYSLGSSGAHGFLYDGANYVTLDHPQAVNGTYAEGISGTKIVGSYWDASLLYHGFIYDGTTWTTLDHPLADTTGGLAHGTRPSAIFGNTVVGSYYDASGYRHGFIYDGLNWSTVDAPLVGIRETILNGIDGDRIVGSYQTGSRWHSFLYENGAWTFLPDAPDTNRYSHATDISGTKIVGYFQDNSEGSDNRGFVYDGMTWTILDHPQATSQSTGGTKTTIISGIDGDIVVGTYTGPIDGHGLGPTYFGFTAIVPEPSGIALGCIATLAGAYLVRRNRKCARAR